MYRIGVRAYPRGRRSLIDEGSSGSERTRRYKHYAYKE
jgi:hypothetical protein